MDMLSETRKRWFGESPVYFQKLKKIALSLGASATAIWVANDSMSLELPETFLTICKYLITLSTGIGVTAQLTQVNPSELEVKQ